MKPDGALAIEMDEPDIEPSEIFCQLGMVVVEGRVPQPSAKGRSVGPHCPHMVGELGRHTCHPEHLQCKRAEVVLKQMNMLWRNHIPMCIEVLLFPDCLHGSQRAHNVDVSLPSNKESCLLLEQWIIQVVPRRSSDSPVSVRALFQAVKSYLHFSQLSAWLNLSHGKSPRNVSYRVSPPGEFCTSNFSQPPVWHTFPKGVISKSMDIKITLGSLPRVHDVPYIRCWESHSEDLEAELEPPHPEADMLDVASLGACPNLPRHPSAATDRCYDPYSGFATAPVAPSTSASRSTDASSGKRYDRAEIDSPRFRKPCVVSEPIMRSNVPNSSLSLRGPTKQPHRPAARPQSMQGPGGNRTIPALSPRRPSSLHAKSPQGGLTTCPEDGLQLQTHKKGGAIPKRLPHRSPPGDLFGSFTSHLMSAPDLEQLGCHSETIDSRKYTHEETKSNKRSSHSPKVIVTQKSPGNQVYYGQDKPTWLMHGVVNKDSTDSDSSSPEIDRYLNKTLATRLDPLSPQEMESYLSTLCSQRQTKRDLSGDRTPGQNQLHHSQTKSPSPLSFSPRQEKDLHETDVFQSGGCPRMHLQSSTPKQTGDSSPTAVKMTADMGEIVIGMSNNLVLNEKLARPADQQHMPTPTQAGRQAALVDPRPDPLPRGRDAAPTIQQTDDRVTFTVGETDSDLPTHAIVNNADLCNNKNIPPATERTEDITDECHVKAQRIIDEAVRSQSPAGRDTTSWGSPVTSQNGADLTEPWGGDDDDDDYQDHGSSPQDIKHSMNGSACGVGAPRKHLVKTKSCPGPSFFTNSCAVSASNDSDRCVPELNKASSLLKSVMRKELSQNAQVDAATIPIVPTKADQERFRQSLHNSANLIFHAATGLPLQSSPAPIKKVTSGSFDFDSSLTTVRAIKNSISCVNLQDEQQNADEDEVNILKGRERFYSTSAPASTNCLLGNFEESMLNGRLEPSGVVEGFTADIGASGAFCPKHLSLPVTAFFFRLSDDNAPSPYLGHIDLESAGKRGYHIPKKGTVQVTLFNPNKTVVKMFVVVYNLTDMPANCQTFLRQRTLYMPIVGGPSDVAEAPIYLRYLIHIRFSSSKSGKIYLHTDVRLIFARDKFEYDSRVEHYELRSFTEGPTNPKFSPKR